MCENLEATKGRGESIYFFSQWIMRKIIRKNQQKQNRTKLKIVYERDDSHKVK